MFYSSTGIQCYPFPLLLCNTTFYQHRRLINQYDARFISLLFCTQLLGRQNPNILIDGRDIDYIWETFAFDVVAASHY